jgi:ubiquinone/menaquinone biosynthesis C-methylase UbiE
MKDYDRQKSIQAYYSARAEEYDRQKSRTWQSARGFGDKIVEEMRQGLNDCDGKAILEVGVGSGRNAELPFESNCAHFTGLDLSREMLKATRTKLVTHRDKLHLILGSGEDLPLIDKAFDTILCISVMHYFTDQRASLTAFERLLKNRGVLVYGDLTKQESDREDFFENLERTISKAHARYYKASEMKQMIEGSGFNVVRTTTIPYQKRYEDLIEDKGRYFGVGIDAITRLTQAASSRTRQSYALTNTGLIQFYTVMIARKKRD